MRKTYTGKLYGARLAAAAPRQPSLLNPPPLLCPGKQDDLCIALQLAIIGAQKFHQDPKYRGFRSHDYATATGLANNPRPRGVA